MRDQPVPLDPESQMAAWQLAIEERLRALETAPRITSTSQRGGSFQLLDDDGNLLFTFGTYTRQEFEDYGIQSRIPTGGGGPDDYTTSLEINVNGMEAPQIPLNIQPLNEYIDVTAGTFTAVWQANASLLVSDSIWWNSIIGADVGTAGQARLESGGVYSDVIPIAAGSFTDIVYKWKHGFSQGGARIFRLEVRRTSGAGTLHVYNPYWVSQGGSAGLSSTAGGT